MFESHGSPCTEEAEMATVRHLICQVHSRGVLPATKARELASKVGPKDFINLAQGILLVTEAGTQMKRQMQRSCLSIADLHGAGKNLVKTAMLMCEGRFGEASEAFINASTALQYYLADQYVGQAVQYLSHFSIQEKPQTPEPLVPKKKARSYDRA